MIAIKSKTRVKLASALKILLVFVALYFPVIWLFFVFFDFNTIPAFFKEHPQVLVCIAIMLTTLLVCLLERVVGGKVKRQFKGFYFRSTPNLGGKTHLEALGIARSFRNPSFDGKLDYDYYVNFTILKWQANGICSFDSDILKFSDVSRVVNPDEKEVLDYLQLKGLAKEFDRWSMEDQYKEAVVVDGDSLVIKLCDFPSLIQTLCSRVNDKYSRHYKYATVSENPVERFFESPDCDTTSDVKAIKKFREEHEYVELQSQSSVKKISAFMIICGLVLSFAASFALWLYFYDGAWFSASSAACALVCGIVLTFVTNSVSRERHEIYSPEDYELTKEVLGLENWIRDFTRLKDQSYDASIVWDDFVLWAALFGLMNEANAIGNLQNATIATSTSYYDKYFKAFDAIIR